MSARILAAFLAILGMFGGVTAYSALTMRRLGDELRRIATGYLTLRLKEQELQTEQSTFVRELERAQGDAMWKNAVDLWRSRRRAELRKVQALIDALGDEPHARRGEAEFLRGLVDRLAAIDHKFVDDEALLDRLYGPPGAQRIAPLDPEADKVARDLLWSRESSALNALHDLATALDERVHTAESQLAADERRAIWATVLLAVIASFLGIGVMLLAQRALAPLRRLAAGAKQLARGDYQQRVDATAKDEIGSLAGEFNAMAAALEEREQRLIRSERLAAVGRIAAQITHEVRNPLSSIGLNAELLLDEGASTETRDLAQAIIKEVDRLTEITEGYLRMTRLPRPKLEREDLNAIVSSLLAFVKEELAGRGVTVEARLDDRLPAVIADENQLRQALLNLIRNAKEAMPSGGRLTVTTSSESGERPVAVRVADTGEGIAPELRSKIFDPFFSTKTGGTGLGLALTQQIVVDHGGAIDVESALARGTTFIVRLPAAETVDEPRIDIATPGAEPPRGV